MAATRIQVMNNGSLRVEGDFEVVDQNGSPFGLAGRTRVSLCRCGQSEHKPFCDNQHLAAGFRAPGLPYKIHLSQVRFRLDRPMTAAEDPRGAE